MGSRRQDPVETPEIARERSLCGYPPAGRMTLSAAKVAHQLIDRGVAAAVLHGTVAATALGARRDIAPELSSSMAVDPLDSLEASS
jgi:hypothetical protein